MTASRRPRARRGEGERLRDEILQATEQLLIKTGDQEAVSIRAIAQAVGVTPPSIYLHFADKTELIFAVCTRHFEALDAAIEAAAAEAADLVDELRARGRAYVRFGLDHPEQYRILFMSKPSAKPVAWSADEMADNAAFSHHVDAVRRAADVGLLGPDVDVQLTAIGFWTAVHGIVSLVISQPDFPWPEIDVLVDHVLSMQTMGLASVASESLGEQ
ncbi:MAG TPA: TetR/AcrR family transcriptional regulator [Acidimicrobiales bacterium]|nr:TetR/AcrR family transcriptional regulator [Acidimicrobiales bacterium]